MTVELQQRIHFKNSEAKNPSAYEDYLKDKPIASQKKLRQTVSTTSLEKQGVSAYSSTIYDFSRKQVLHSSTAS